MGGKGKEKKGKNPLVLLPPHPKVMGDFAGAQLFNNGPQLSPAELSFQTNQFSSLDFLQRQNSFGFSPGTSPAGNDIKNERGDSFFDAQNRSHPLGSSSFLATSDFRYNSPVKNSLYNTGTQPCVQQPIRLHIPSTSSKQKHGQLTPPSETTPTKENPPSESPKEPRRSPSMTRNGPATKKRRSTQPPQVSDPPAQPTVTPRRRKKSSRKQQSSGSTADGDDKRSQFLERNRLAASKCRQKKKEWTSNLEQRARELQASRRSLSLLVSSLREELLYLKGEALKHTTCDCNSVREYLARHAEASLPRRRLEYVQSPHSGSTFSFGAMDMDASIIHDSPTSSAMTENQDLPELNILGQIPD